MKNKILYADVTRSIEELAAALRKFSGSSMFCAVEVMTRDKEQDAEAPDLYTFRVHFSGSDDVVIAEGGWIYRDSEDKIAKVERIGEGGGHD